MCNCGSRKNRVGYEVRFGNGVTQTYNTVAEAQAAGAKAKQAYTIRAVSKQPAGV